MVNIWTGGDWSQGSNWTENRPPYSNEDVEVAGRDCRIDIPAECGSMYATGQYEFDTQVYIERPLTINRDLIIGDIDFHQLGFIDDGGNHTVHVKRDVIFRTYGWLVWWAQNGTIVVDGNVLFEGTENGFEPMYGTIYGDVTVTGSRGSLQLPYDNGTLEIHGNVTGPAGCRIGGGTTRTNQILICHGNVNIYRLVSCSQTIIEGDLNIALAWYSQQATTMSVAGTGIQNISYPGNLALPLSNLIIGVNSETHISRSITVSGSQVGVITDEGLNDGNLDVVDLTVNGVLYAYNPPPALPAGIPSPYLGRAP